MKERVNLEVRSAIKEKLNQLIGNQSNGVSGFAEIVGVTRDDVNNWLRDKSDMRLSALVAIAKQYNVSTDYILGLSAHSSPDTSIQGVEKTTGLRREAIESLIDMDSYFRGMSKMLLNDLLSSETFMHRWLFCLEDVTSQLASARDTLETLEYDPEDIDSITDAQRTIFEKHRNLRLALFDFSEMSNTLVDTLYSSRATILALEEKERELSKKHNTLYNTLYSGMPEEILQEIYGEGKGAEGNGKESK